MSTLLSTEPLPFEVSERRESSRVRVTLRGELDLATAHLLADRLRLLRERHDTVVLDLEELTFIDAAGVRVILGAAQDSQNDGWAFTVTRGSGVVRRLFELLDLDPLLPLEGEAS
jgi:anti-anti-sigma factor